MSDEIDYRHRMYARYPSAFQDASPVFDLVAARHWGRAYRHYFRNWLPEDKEVAIMDLACGWGRGLQYLKDQGYVHITGVDISHEAAAIARQVVSDVRQEDVLQFLKATRDTCSLIIALDIIEHFRKSEILEFLDGCYRVLKPGGRLILQTPNGASPLFGTMAYGDMTHEWFYTPAQLLALLKNVGFAESQVRECGPYIHGLSSMVRWCVWQLVSGSLCIWNLAETGGNDNNVFTRVFLATAVKP